MPRHIFAIQLVAVKTQAISEQTRQQEVLSNMCAAAFSQRTREVRIPNKLDQVMSAFLNAVDEETSRAIRHLAWDAAGPARYDRCTLP